MGWCKLASAWGKKIKKQVKQDRNWAVMSDYVDLFTQTGSETVAVHEVTAECFKSNRRHFLNLTKSGRFLHLFSSSFICKSFRVMFAIEVWMSQGRHVFISYLRSFKLDSWPEVLKSRGEDSRREECRGLNEHKKVMSSLYFKQLSKLFTVGVCFGFDHFQCGP